MADQGIGDPSDSKASNSTGTWTVISLLKGIMGNTGGGGSAVSIADGSDVTEGAIADAAVTAGATGTVSAKLRSISRDVGTVATASATQSTAAKQDTGNTSLSTIATNTTAESTAVGTIGDTAVTAGASGSVLALLRTLSRDLVANIVLKAGSAIIGQVGVDQTTPGTTDSVTVKASVGIGSLTETAPATDTASSGLNGRLQRIAQRLTSLIALVPTALGQTTKSASFAVTPASDWGAFDSTDKFRISLYGKNSAAGDTVLVTQSDGALRVSLEAGTSQTSNVSAVSSSSSDATALGSNGFGVASTQHMFNGTNYDRKRNNNSNSVLASAARTATANADITTYNAKTFRVILNITAAPNTASTLTLSIRAKDSISSNYVTLLTGGAETGSVDTGAVPVTKTYSVGAGLVATANVSSAEALARTMNVLVTHSNADSWTYSVSVELGV